jgi:folate-binding protein YgfZ
MSLPLCVRLDDLAVLAVTGEDATDFLHRQITNDVLRLDPSQARWAAYCTAQGRMLATMVVWRPQADELRLLVARDIVEPLLKRLSMFILRSKVRIQRLDHEVLGCFLPPSSTPSPPAPTTPWSRAQTAEGEWIAAPHGEGQPARAWLITPACPEAGGNDDAWRAADIQAGLPWIRAATQDMFIPQTLNMDLNGGIDFKKGCYPGQEIIARSHYRGTIKRRMAYGTAPWAPGAILPGEGDDIHAADEDDGRPVGRIIDLAVLDTTLHVLIERTLSDPPETRYRLGSPQGPVLTLHAMTDGIQPS